MTIPNLRLPRLTNSGTRGAGVSRGTPGYRPRHAAPDHDIDGADRKAGELVEASPGRVQDAMQPQPAVEAP